MKNPLEQLSIFQIITPKNQHGERAAFGWITVKYSENGTAMAFYNYELKTCGRAGGGGYDKTGTALAKAIEKLTGCPMPCGSAGVSIVIEAAHKQKILITQLRDLLPKY